MRFLYSCIGLHLLVFIIYNLLSLNVFHWRRSSHRPTNDQYENCLFRLGRALDQLQIRWFITHGSALTYWRSKSLIGSDIDTGIFYDDYRAKNLTEKSFLKFLRDNYRLKILSNYGQIKHGKEWTFVCVDSAIHIDIFFFYEYNETKYSFKYWAASYNGLCEKMIYRKCRWGFSDFNLTQVNIKGYDAQIVPLSFVIERYGKDYMKPKRYSYFQSLKILPNLMKEYREK